MTKASTQSDRKALIANLAKVWPEAKLGKVKTDDLVWLALVAAEMPKGKRDMSSTLRKYRDLPDHYQVTTSYTGRKSLSIGDEVAEFLDGMSPAEVLASAERILGMGEGELTNRYNHLNLGQQRMNGGNRLRAALKRGDITTKDLN